MTCNIIDTLTIDPHFSIIIQTIQVLLASKRDVILIHFQYFLRDQSEKTCMGYFIYAVQEAIFKLQSIYVTQPAFPNVANITLINIRDSSNGQPQIEAFIKSS